MAEKKLTKYEQELQRLADSVGREDLTRTQKKAIDANLKDEKVSPAMVSYYTGIPEATIKSRMKDRHLGKGAVTDLRYRPSRGFYGRAPNGESVVLYAVRDPQEQGNYSAFFGTASDIEHAIKDRENCPSPPCDDDDNYEVVIPLKDGERSNIEP